MVTNTFSKAQVKRSAMMPATKASKALSGQQLPDHPPTAGSEGKANAQFILPRCSTR